MGDLCPPAGDWRMIGAISSAGTSDSGSFHRTACMLSFLGGAYGGRRQPSSPVLMYGSSKKTEGSHASSTDVRSSVDRAHAVAGHGPARQVPNRRDDDRRPPRRDPQGSTDVNAR